MADQPVHLYGFYIAQPVRTIAEFLKVNNIAFGYTPTNLFTNEHKTPEFLAISPSGTIPTLTHGDVALSETFAMVQYIAETFGIDNNWWPSDHKQKALVNCYLHWHHTNIRNCSYLVYNTAYIRKVLGRDPAPGKIPEFQKKVKNSLDFIESVLATGKYVARTTEPSVADIAFYNEATALRVINYDFGPYPHVRRLIDTIESIVPVQEINQMAQEIIDEVLAS